MVWGKKRGGKRKNILRPAGKHYHRNDWKHLEEPKEKEEVISLLKEQLEVEEETAKEIATWIFVNDGVDSLWKNTIEQLGVRVIELPTQTKRLSLKEVFGFLGQAEIDEVFIEPGRRLLQSLIHEKWINQWLVFESPNMEPEDQLHFLAYDYRISTHFQQVSEEQVGDDTLRLFAPKEE